MESLTLEKSTNTHVLETKGKIVDVKEYENGIMGILTTKEGAIVTHGEHGTLTVEAEKVFKYIQQEQNPVTKKIRNSID